MPGRRTPTPAWGSTAEAHLDDRMLEELDRALRPRTTVWDIVVIPSLRNIVIALLAGVIAGVLVGAASLGRAPVYTSSTTMLIDQPGVVVTNNDVGVIQKLNALRQKYAALIPTAPVAAEVGRTLGISRDQVARSVTAYAPGESLVLVVTARAADRNGAMKLADTVAAQLTRYVDDEMTRNAVPSDKRITLAAIDPAHGAAKLSPTASQATSAGLFFGLVVLVGAYVLLQLVVAGRRTTR